MKKLLNWILNCDSNRVEALQNWGFALSMAWLTIGFFSQFLKPLLPLTISITFLAINLFVWLLGMVWAEIRERAENLWQSN